MVGNAFARMSKTIALHRAPFIPPAITACENFRSISVSIEESWNGHALMVSGIPTLTTSVFGSAKTQAYTDVMAVAHP